MQLTPRNFELLNAMEIPIWVQRDRNSTDNNSVNEHIPVPEGVAESQIFTDVLKALALTIEEICITDEQIDLGASLWCFTDKPQITFVGNKLLTPSHSIISANNQLKKTLWQTLQSNLIN